MSEQNKPTGYRSDFAVCVCSAIAGLSVWNAVTSGNAAIYTLTGVAIGIVLNAHSLPREPRA